MPTTTTQAPLSDFGVVSARGADTTTLWSAGFPGTGQGAVTVYFAEEPEHRAIEALCERFGADACHVTPPQVREAS